MHEIKVDIRLIPRPEDDRHDLEIERTGIDADELPACLEWVLHQLRLNKHKKFKAIKGGSNL